MKKEVGNRGLDIQAEDTKSLCNSCKKEISSKKQYCGIVCRNRGISETRKIYPKKVGVCLNCKNDIIATNGGYKNGNSEYRKYCNKSCKATFENTGFKWDKERKERASIRRKKYFADIGYVHKLTPNERSRKSVKCKEWRKAVFERDDYTCQICFQKGGKLNADHIKAWIKYPDLRFDIKNGRTLCITCHRKTDNYGIKAIHS